MASRLVMLAVIDARISPRCRAQGREKATRVKGLGKGEMLEMEVTNGQGQILRIIPLNEGEHPIPSPLKRGDEFMIRKLIGGISATTVEVILG